MPGWADAQPAPAPAKPQGDMPGWANAEPAAPQGDMPGWADAAPTTTAAPQGDMPGWAATTAPQHDMPGWAATTSAAPGSTPAVEPLPGAGPNWGQPTTSQPTQFSGMIDELSVALSAITKALGNIGQVGSYVDTSKNFGGVNQEWAADAAGQVADALKMVLSALESDADFLFARVLQAKGMLSEGMDNADPSTVLTHFGTSMQTSLDLVAAFWQNMAASVTSGGEAVLLALRQSGQGVLASQLQPWLDRAVSEIHNIARVVMVTRSDATGAMDGIQTPLPQNRVWQGKTKMLNPNIEQILGERLTKMYSRMQKLPDHIDAFDGAFRGLVQGMTDSVINTLVSRQSKEWSAAVNGKFSVVQDATSSVMWRVRAAGREFSTSVQRTTVQVADALHIELDKSVVHQHPPMPGSTKPPYMPYGAFGAAGRARCGVAAVVAAVCTGLLVL